MRKIGLSAQIILGMFIGIFTGLILREKAAPLGEIGKLLIQIIKVVAGPLLFFTIIKSIQEAHIPLRAGGRLFAIIIINVSAALCIALFMTNVFQPGAQLAEITKTLSPSTENGISPLGFQKLSFAKVVANFFPSSIAQPFVDNNIMGLVFLAVLLGFALRAQTTEGLRLQTANVLGVIASTFEKTLAWIVKFAPLAVFGVVAKAVGEHGFAPFRGLASYVAVGLCALTLQMVLVYFPWIAFYSKHKLRTFLRESKEALVYSIGANSSLATLPLTLQTLKRLKVSESASTLGACVATNFNNDGIVLYEALAAIFVAQAHGIHLDLAQQLTVVGASLVAALGIAGVPEAGFISLSIVLTTVGLPTELLPLLLTVDWILARARSVVNVAADLTNSVILDTWMQNEKTVLTSSAENTDQVDHPVPGPKTTIRAAYN